MNVKNLPFQVLEEWHQIAKIMAQSISESGLSFQIKPNKTLGRKITYKKFDKIFFEVAGYSIGQKDKTVYFSVNQVPTDRYTAIDESFEGEVDKTYRQTLDSFQDWLDIVKGFEKFNPSDIDRLFSIETDEIFLKDEPDTFSEKDKVLSFCLKSLFVSNFQGAKKATIENLPVDTNWVFLVGENGFGKSSILQAIALGLHGSKDGPLEYISDNNARINVEYKSDGGNVINDFRKNISPLPHFATYGPVRLNMQVDASVSEAAQKSGTLYSLFKTDGVLLNIESELVKWKLKNDKRFELVKTAFCKLVPNIASIQFNTLTDRIEYVEKDVVGSEGVYDPLPFEKIASGFRSVLGIAGDMIVRLSNTQKDVEDPSQLKGIVIIDELDLHWHPKLQKQIPALFSEVFPNIQFIVSTHSPIPLLGAPKNSVILKVTRTKEEGITIQKIDIDLKNLTPNLLLTSGIFDMDNIFSSQVEDMTEVRTEDSFEDMEDNIRIDGYLANFEKSNEQFPDELFESKKN